MAQRAMREYVIRRAAGESPLAGDSDGGFWREANVLEVAHFRPEGSDHHPRTLVKALHDTAGIRVLFTVEDRHVRSVQTSYGGPVHTDSCVEFFVRPKPDKGYCNFEVNCGGTLHCSYIEDWTRTPAGFERRTPIPEEIGRCVEVYHSMPSVVDPEIEEPVEWRVELFVPFSLLARYVGPLGEVRGQSWRANFYKCAEDTSHPHWAAWSPVEELNFHLPECFGVMRFGE